MFKLIQEELFGIEDYTFLCRNCRRGYPRSIEFFPKGRSKDKMSSFCRKCSISIGKIQSSSKKDAIQKKRLFSPEKTCEDCGETKQIREFYMSSKSIDGKTIACKEGIDETHSERESRQKCFRGFSWVVFFIQDSIQSWTNLILPSFRHNMASTTFFPNFFTMLYCAKSKKCFYVYISRSRRLCTNNF